MNEQLESEIRTAAFREKEILEQQKRLHLSMVEKEQTIIKREQSNATFGNEVKGLRDQIEMQGTKLRALERFSSEL